jgi:hypothetical protein
MSKLEVMGHGASQEGLAGVSFDEVMYDAIALASWVLFGAIVGHTAATRRGFSPAAGLMGGVLLGCCSPLMFLVSGGKKRCAYCAEWIEKNAAVCRFCGRCVHGASAPRDG